jgi:hypothetical protein
MQGPGSNQSRKSGTNHNNVELLLPNLHQPSCSAIEEMTQQSGRRSA